MTVFPLSAIVGQARLVEALLVNAVAPEVGGVLVRGHRGTAKSTAVRALAPLLPAVSAAAAQPEAWRFAPGELAPDGRVAAGAVVQERPAPLVELPLGATLDRVIGAVDLRAALAGAHAFEAGLLARAHRGILYVDEVNLLPDHLVDALLDTAASGVVRVEREAVSVVHDARFMLVGTMNVEEGELRPQLLDRFGLGVEVDTPADPGERAEIVRRRLAFEDDPAAFADVFAEAEAALAERIAAGRRRLPHVELPARELLRITGACAKLGVDGVRGDIVTARAARALAALDGAGAVTEDHVRRAAALALAHRRRRDPLDGSAPSDTDLQEALDGPPPPPDHDPDRPDPGPGGPEPEGPGPEGPGPEGRSDGAPPPDAGDRPPFVPEAPARPRRDPPAPARLPSGAVALSGRGRGPRGRRGASAGPGSGAIDSRPLADGGEVAVVPTLVARLAGRDAPLREPVRAGREGALVVLVLDTSGSMGARRRAARVKGALLSFLRDAYARRDRVAVVCFGEGGARLLVAPGAPLERAAAAIRELPTGGRTPLAAGLALAESVLARERARERSRRQVALVLTDGRVTDAAADVPRAAAALGRAADAVHVVDTEEGPVRLGLAARIALAAGGEIHRLEVA